MRARPTDAGGVRGNLAWAEVVRTQPARARGGQSRGFAWAHRAALASVVAAAALSGCKTLPEKPAGATAVVTGDWGARKSVLQARQQFQFKGRVAVAAGSDGFNARLLWQQSGSQSFVALDGPLGAGGVQITNDGPSLTVTTSRGDRLDSAAAHGELQSKLGFDPPIGSLRFWVLGVPDPAQPSKETLNPQQRLGGLSQEGWDIAYDAYAPAGNETLPSRVTMQRKGVRVKLIVDSWTGSGG